MKIPDKLKHVYNLALNGVDGEQAVANKVLQKLLKKYNVSLSQLQEEDDNIDVSLFNVRKGIQQKLLRQIAYKVLDTQPDFYCAYVGESQRLSPSKLGVKCTKSQAIEIQFLFDFYIKLWETEVDKLMYAFIIKHSLFGTGDVDNTEDSLSLDKLEKILNMVEGLDSKTPYKQLKAGD